MARIFDPELPKDDPNYAAIGHAAAIWGMLEHIIDAAISDLADFNRKETNSEAIGCLTAQMISVHSRFDALIALAHLRGLSEKLIKKLTAYSNEVRPLAIRRNRLIHDPVTRHLLTGAIVQTRITTKGPKGSLQYGFYPFDIAECEKFTDTVRQKVAAFHLLWNDLSAEKAAILDKPPLLLPASPPGQSPKSETS